MKHICCNCGKEKDLEKDFYKSKYNALGYSYHCKKCSKEKAKVLHQKHYQQNKITHDEWVKNHKKQYQEYQKDYRNSHKKERRDWCKKEAVKAVERRQKRIKEKNEKNM
jgi:hypothetical protein